MASVQPIEIAPAEPQPITISPLEDGRTKVQTSMYSGGNSETKQAYQLVNMNINGVVKSMLVPVSTPSQVISGTSLVSGGVPSISNGPPRVIKLPPNMKVNASQSQPLGKNSSDKKITWVHPRALPVPGNSLSGGQKIMYVPPPKLSRGGTMQVNGNRTSMISSGPPPLKPKPGQNVGICQNMQSAPPVVLSQAAPVVVTIGTPTGFSSSQTVKHLLQAKGDYSTKPKRFDGVTLTTAQEPTLYKITSKGLTTVAASSSNSYTVSVSSTGSKIINPPGKGLFYDYKKNTPYKTPTPPPIVEIFGDTQSDKNTFKTVSSNTKLVPILPKSEVGLMGSPQKSPEKESDTNDGWSIKIDSVYSLSQTCGDHAYGKEQREVKPVEITPYEDAVEIEDDFITEDTVDDAYDHVSMESLEEDSDQSTVDSNEKAVENVENTVDDIKAADGNSKGAMEDVTVKDSNGGGIVQQVDESRNGTVVYDKIESKQDSTNNVDHECLSENTDNEKENECKGESLKRVEENEEHINDTDKKKDISFSKRKRKSKDIIVPSEKEANTHETQDIKIHSKTNATQDTIKQLQVLAKLQEDGATSAGGNGVNSAVGNGAISAVGNGAISAVGNGVISAVGNGAISAVGNGANSVVGSGAISAVGNGAISAVGNGAISAVGTRRGDEDSQNSGQNEKENEEPSSISEKNNDKYDESSKYIGKEIDPVDEKCDSDTVIEEAIQGYISKALQQVALADIKERLKEAPLPPEVYANKTRVDITRRTILPSKPSQSSTVATVANVTDLSLEMQAKIEKDRILSKFQRKRRKLRFKMKKRLKVFKWKKRFPRMFRSAIPLVKVNINPNETVNVKEYSVPRLPDSVLPKYQTGPEKKLKAVRNALAKKNLPDITMNGNLMNPNIGGGKKQQVVIVPAPNGKFYTMFKYNPSSGKNEKHSSSLFQRIVPGGSVIARPAPASKKRFFTLPDRPSTIQTPAIKINMPMTGTASQVKRAPSLLPNSILPPGLKIIMPQNETGVAMASQFAPKLVSMGNNRPPVLLQGPLLQGTSLLKPPLVNHSTAKPGPIALLGPLGNMSKAGSNIVSVSSTATAGTGPSSISPGADKVTAANAALKGYSVITVPKAGGGTTTLLVPSHALKHLQQSNKIPGSRLTSTTTDAKKAGVDNTPSTVVNTKPSLIVTPSTSGKTVSISNPSPLLTPIQTVISSDNQKLNETPKPPVDSASSSVVPPGKVKLTTFKSLPADVTSASVSPEVSKNKMMMIKTSTGMFMVPVPPSNMTGTLIPGANGQGPRFVLTPSKAQNSANLTKGVASSGVIIPKVNPVTIAPQQDASTQGTAEKQPEPKPIEIAPIPDDEAVSHPPLTLPYQSKTVTDSGEPPFNPFGKIKNEPTTSGYGDEEEEFGPPPPKKAKSEEEQNEQKKRIENLKAELRRKTELLDALRKEREENKSVLKDMD